MSWIKFPRLEFTAPGVYLYTIKELTPSGCGWATDSRVFRVVVTVTEGSKGSLVSAVDYLDGFPEFINKFRNTKCNVCCPCKRNNFPHCLPCCLSHERRQGCKILP